MRIQLGGFGGSGIVTIGVLGVDGAFSDWCFADAAEQLVHTVRSAIFFMYDMFDFEEVRPEFPL